MLLFSLGKTVVMRVALATWMRLWHADECAKCCLNDSVICKFAAPALPWDESSFCMIFRGNRWLTEQSATHRLCCSWRSAKAPMWDNTGDMRLPWEACRASHILLVPRCVASFQEPPSLRHQAVRRLWEAPARLFPWHECCFSSRWRKFLSL